MTSKEQNIARVFKQLVYILEENSFTLYYDKRFPNLQPQLDKDHDYLYHHFLDNPHHPLVYLSFKNNELDYQIDYRDTFTHTLHYSKYKGTAPRNPYTSPMETILNPYQTYTEESAKELATAIFKELMDRPTHPLTSNDVLLTKYRTFTALTK